MASRPWWTRQEWVLLVDLYARTRPHVSEADLQRLHHDLRLLGDRSDDPFVRQAARDPGYRSIGAVWTQLDVLRQLAELDTAHVAPARLREVWAQFVDSQTAYTTKPNGRVNSSRIPSQSCPTKPGKRAHQASLRTAARVFRRS